MENVGLREYLIVLGRRKAAYFVTATLIFAASVAFAYLWPPTYRATGTIQIAQPDIPADLTAPEGEAVSDEVQVFADQRIQQIQQKIVDSANLNDIITDDQLYPEELKTQPRQEVIQKMQKAIKLELVSADLANPGAVTKLSPGQLAAIAFDISFDYRDPLTAQKVANELISRFLDEDLKQRSEQAKAASDFLAMQAAQLEQQLSEQERAMGAFRKQHAGGLQDDLAFNLQGAQTQSMTIDSLTQQIAGLDQQRADLQSKLATTEPYATVVSEGQPLTSPQTMLRELQFQYTTLLGRYGVNHPDVVKLRRQIEALQGMSGGTADTADIGSKLEDLEAKLKVAEHDYGPDHPDVLSLKRQIDYLERQKGLVTPTNVDKLNVRDADNPDYVMMQYQLKSLDSQYKTLVQQRDDAQKQYEHYEQLIAETPAVEQEMEGLSRDYDNAQLRYREVKEKKLSADMTQQMEQGRQGERLEVIDYPQLPLRPHFPPRPIVIAAGFVLATLGGLGGVQMREAMSGAVHGTHHLTELLGQPPLVAVPTIFSRDDRRKRRSRLIMIAVVAVAVLTAALVAYNYLVTPLDVVWSVIMLRMGIS
jgi:uncharacterized protein involved in exopolysaccharide biosynthesis